MDIKEKNYKTRAGHPVRILCTDRDHKLYPVVALITMDGEQVVAVYRSDGKYCNREQDKYDLRE